MSVLDAIAAATVAEVEHAGIRWQVRRVTSRLVSTNKLRLLRLAAPTAEDNAEDEGIASIPDEAERAQRKVQVRSRRFLARSADPATVAAAVEMDAALLAAGVVAAWDPDTGAWLPVAIVPEGSAVDREATPPRVPVDALPGGTGDALVAAIWRLSINGEAAAERVRSFRDGA